MVRKIKFTHSGSSAVFGNFAPGDRLTCGDAEAQHFVEEACCAVYDDVTQTSATAGDVVAKKVAAKRASKAKGSRA